MPLYHKDPLMRYSIRAGTFFFISAYVLSVRSALGNMMSGLARVNPIVKRAFKRMMAYCTKHIGRWMLEVGV